MESEQAKRVAAWLETFPHICNVRPVMVTIKGKRYQGADYESVGHYEPSMGAVQSGQHKAGEAYTTRRLYLVGPLPACYKRSSRTCFRFQDGLREWYVASCIDSVRITPQNAEFHPFGEAFQLAPWEVPDGSAIDAHESKPYARVAATLESAS